VDGTSAQLFPLVHGGGNPLFVHELWAALESDCIDAGSAEPERVLGLVPEALTQRLLMRVMLFITVKAVEWHLHRAYLKLNNTSRKQLAQALTTEQEKAICGRG
jgi:hypothetical protein